MFQSSEKSDEKIRLHYQSLSKVAETIRLVLNLDELLEKLSELVFEVFNPDRCVIMMNDEETGKMVPKVTKKSKSNLEEVSISRTIVEQAVKQQMSLLISDTADDKKYSAVESIMVNKIRTAICSPMICNKITHGILYIDTTTKLLSYNEDDLELFTNIAALAATSIANAQYHEKQIKQVRA